MKFVKNVFYCLLAAAVFVLSACSGDNKKYIIIETEYGNMKVELFNSAPKHKANMLRLAKEGYYDDLLFHRVINGFMIQGGDPNSRNATAETALGSGGPNYLIDAEIGSPHFKGTLAAARTGDFVNPEKKSSGSQFYIVQGTPQSRESLKSIAHQKGIQYSEAQIQKYLSLGGTPMLDQEYTVFGEVVEGMEVIDKIASVPTGGADRPVHDVKMKIKLTN